MELLLPNRNPIYTLDQIKIAALRAKEWQGKYPDKLGVLPWIAAMEPFIRQVSEAGQTSALVHREASALASAGLAEGFILAAEHSCVLYNLQPKTMARTASSTWAPIHQNGGGGNGGGRGGGSGSGSGSGGGGCPANGSFSGYWWGYEFYLNHCAIGDISTVESDLGQIATVLAAIPGIGAIATLVLTAVAAFLSIEGQWLSWADSHCNNGGAFLDGTWVSVGTPWVRTVC